MANKALRVDNVNGLEAIARYHLAGVAITRRFNTTGLSVPVDKVAILHIKLPLSSRRASDTVAVLHLRNVLENTVPFICRIRGDGFRSMDSKNGVIKFRSVHIPPLIDIQPKTCEVWFSIAALILAIRKSRPAKMTRFRKSCAISGPVSFSLSATYSAIPGFRATRRTSIHSRIWCLRVARILDCRLALVKVGALRIAKFDRMAAMAFSDKSEYLPINVS
jgi:hypothetical protein